MESCETFWPGYKTGRWNLRTGARAKGSVSISSWEQLQLQLHQLLDMPSQLQLQLQLSARICGNQGTEDIVADEALRQPTRRCSPGPPRPRWCSTPAHAPRRHVPRHLAASSTMQLPAWIAALPAR